MNSRKELVEEIARREGKKSETSIGNIYEIVRILVDMQVEAYDNVVPGPSEIILEESKKKFIIPIPKSIH